MRDRRSFRQGGRERDRKDRRDMHETTEAQREKVATQGRGGVDDDGHHARLHERHGAGVGEETRDVEKERAHVRDEAQVQGKGREKRTCRCERRRHVRRTRSGNIPSKAEGRYQTIDVRWKRSYEEKKTKRHPHGEEGYTDVMEHRRNQRNEWSGTRKLTDEGRRSHVGWFHVEGKRDDGELWIPNQQPVVAGAAPAQVSTGGGDEHRARTPPPDLPSLLLDSRIVYIGMPLVPAVTELVVAELLYLQSKDANKPVYLYINSSGCSRQDGETVGFETEATAIYDTMKYIKNPVHTVGVGIAIGQACMLLAAGSKGNRYMLPHATAMLHQPRVPPSGQRQAVEIEIKWKEVLAQKQVYLDILSEHTGQTVQKLEKDMSRPFYMQPKDAVAYGVIDHVLTEGKRAIDAVKKADEWDKEAGLRPVYQ